MFNHLRLCVWLPCCYRLNSPAFEPPRGEDSHTRLSRRPSKGTQTAVTLFVCFNLETHFATAWAPSQNRIYQKHFLCEKQQTALIVWAIHSSQALVGFLVAAEAVLAWTTIDWSNRGTLGNLFTTMFRTEISEDQLVGLTEGLVHRWMIHSEGSTNYPEIKISRLSNTSVYLNHCTCIHNITVDSAFAVYFCCAVFDIIVRCCACVH